MYKSVLNTKDTLIAIKSCKDYFEKELADALNLTRVSAPLFVTPESGLNDALNGVERPVEFDLLETGRNVQIVQSLAKWKRYALGKYGFSIGEGLYTDMNAIRRDETTDCLHSVYVDQWDWEKNIGKQGRTISTLFETVKQIYAVLKKTERHIISAFPSLKESYNEFSLPEEITFISTQQLEDEYPDLEPKKREDIAARKYGAVCLTGIGGKLNSGNRHDGRSPDYDDWSMNCDIILYYPLLDRAFEISSMGIRVDEKSLSDQLDISGCNDRRNFPFHKAILNCELPYTVGGGIGQSRLCMYFLRKLHIGEVQVSVWPESEIDKYKKLGCEFL